APESHVLAQWFAFGVSFNVGAYVAAGDVTNSGHADVVAGATAGNPQVKVYDGRAIAAGTTDPESHLLASFFAYGISVTVGAFVAVGDTTGDGYADIITGATAGNPDVHVYDGKAIAQGTFNNSNPDASQVAQFFAYGLQFNIGAAVATGYFEGATNKADILTGASKGTPHYRIVSGSSTGTQPPVVKGMEGIVGDIQGGIFVGA